MFTDHLTEFELRDRIKVIASGKLITPADVAWALCVGADFIVSARGFLFSLGCIQAMQCNKNTCPTGIATHNPKLQKGLDPENKSLRVFNYIQNINEEVGIISHSCGVKNPRMLKRKHMQIINKNGRSVNYTAVFPDNAFH